MVGQHPKETINSFLLTENLRAAPVPVLPEPGYTDFSLILSNIYRFLLKSVSVKEARAKYF